MKNQKEEFLKEFCKAFAAGRFTSILDKISEDFQWTILGQEEVIGKDKLPEALANKQMVDSETIEFIDVHAYGNKACINGNITNIQNSEKLGFSFSEVYEFSEGEDLKIKHITTHTIDR